MLLVLHEQDEGFVTQGGQEKELTNCSLIFSCLMLKCSAINMLLPPISYSTLINPIIIVLINIKEKVYCSVIGHMTLT